MYVFEKAIRGSSLGLSSHISVILVPTKCASLYEGVMYHSWLQNAMVTVGSIKIITVLYIFHKSAVTFSIFFSLLDHPRAGICSPLACVPDVLEDNRELGEVTEVVLERWESFIHISATPLCS